MLTRARALEVIFFTLVLAAAWVPVVAQVHTVPLPAVHEAPSATPTLTEVERLRLMTHAQQLEIAQLRLQQAARDFEQARAAWTAQVEAVQRDGYTLDLETMTYQPAPAPQEAAVP